MQSKRGHINTPGGIPRRDPPSCEAPRQPTIYVTNFPNEKLVQYSSIENLSFKKIWYSNVSGIQKVGIQIPTVLM